MTPDELTDWVDDRLRVAGRRRTGPVAVFRERAWADVHTVPTDGGPVWLKVCRDPAEPTVYAVLADVAAEHVLEPLGVDTTRHLVLLPDGGPALGDRLSGADLDAAMIAALRTYARVQQATTDQVDRLVAGGVPDMRPAAMPRRLAEALDRTQAYVDGPADDDQRRDHAALRELAPRFAQWCAELDASPFAAALDHNDLHPRNVVGRPGHPLFWDWGDSAVAHPFAVLLFALESAPPHNRAALRDAYLGEYGDPVTLRATADLAVRVGQVARALVWSRALRDEPLDHPHAAAPLEHLRRLLSGSAG